MVFKKSGIEVVGSSDEYGESVKEIEALNYRFNLL